MLRLQYLSCPRVGLVHVITRALGLQRKVADADISQGILKLTPGSTNTVPGTVCFSTLFYSVPLFSNLEHHHIGDGSKALFPLYGSVVI